MRVVIDAQGMQSESRYRGIGRYVSSFITAVIRNKGRDDQVILALNGLFPETIEPIRALYGDLIGNEGIRVWYAPPPVSERYLGNDRRRETAELMREAFLQSLNPDVIHVTSLFEGFVDDAITSIGRLDKVTPVTVSVYDLIPLINPQHYLKAGSQYTDFYKRKLTWLDRATAYLGISSSSCDEARMYLPCVGKQVVNVSTAVEDRFSPNSDIQIVDACHQHYGIRKTFVLYTGGADERKNLRALIQAYAAVPQSIRSECQLVLAGRMPEESVLNLKMSVVKSGLGDDEVIFTGYVDDTDLVALYRSCSLFVFPSWHEGFGLPVLEAMACGAPVIGANTTSIPEVIGLSEAMFDPFNIEEMTHCMIKGKTDQAFRDRLLKNAADQVKKFSWDRTAQKAWACWYEIKKPVATWVNQSVYQEILMKAVAKDFRNTRAALPSAACLALNRQAGLQRQLLVDVSELSHRDAATGVQRVVRSYLEQLLRSPPEGYLVEPICGSVTGGYVYARSFTKKFLGLEQGSEIDSPISWCRGDILFCLDMQHHVQISNAPLYRQLMKDGVAVKFLVHDLLPIELPSFFDVGTKELHEKLLQVIASTDGAICVSKATRDALADWFKKSGIRLPPNFRNSWVHNGADIQASHPSVGLPDDAVMVMRKIKARPTFLCVSTIEPRKAQGQILAAMDLFWSKGFDANLVFIGKPGWQVEPLVEKIVAHHEYGERLFWLQGISDEYLEEVYDASNCLVAASINEGFGLSLVEAAHYKLSIIARDIPVFREIAEDQAHYFKGFSAEDLLDALEAWIQEYRTGKCEPANLMFSSWQESAERLKEELLIGVKPQQLLVDVSELAVRDAKSGIQRVVKNILSEWLQMPTAPFEVVPVYALPGQPYRSCAVVNVAPLVLKQNPDKDKAIDYAPGDYFVGLDFQPNVVQSQHLFYKQLRRSGVIVKFVIYDLLSIRMPQYFVPGTAESFKEWLSIVCETDGAVCISQTVAEDLAVWVSENAPKNFKPLKIDWFRLGADFKKSKSEIESEDDISELLCQFKRRRTFLVVGTLEPRKGHMQVLDTFEALWAEGLDINLVIVGKQGWMVDDLASRLASHREKNHRLFWLGGISDGFLERVYEASDCLIASSYGEGFGLPLVEAGQRGIPVLARDIPVFREVASCATAFFHDNYDLNATIRNFIDTFNVSEEKSSSDIKQLSWSESAKELLDVLLRGK